jgi:maltogenic amylase-like protein/caspase domain-containing protein
MSRLMDPVRSRVLLIGAGTFGPEAELADLPSVAAGIQELHRLLVDPRRGGLTPEACRTILDPDSTSEVDRLLWQCADEAEDTLLVYYSGHGVPSPSDGSLHFAVRGTERRRLRSTAIPYEWIHDAMQESAARAKVIILDCCFAGRAIRTMSAGELIEEIDVAGAFTMTATPPNVRALAPEGERFTAFTGTMIELLEGGVPDAGEYLDLDTLYRRARALLRERGRPVPEARRLNEAAQLALSRNPAVAARAPAGELPGNLAEQVRSSSPGDRLGTVSSLMRIARGPSRHAAAAAAQLEAMARDDPDPKVAEAAAEERPPRTAPKPLEPEPGWYRTAVFYDIHVPAFFDTNADGVGDLAGVADKVDYIEWLGVDAVILSRAATRDDPHDLFELLDAFHARGLRVICDLPVESHDRVDAWLEMGVDGVRLGPTMTDAVGPFVELQPQLAPRILMALAREDHTPIAETVEPDPAKLQPGLLLRDGDAMPLDRLTDEEIDYMFATYARDPSGAAKHSIRRRLAPMLDGDQDAIKLAHVLLLTLPGSPVLYYGDEIGMGEDLTLEDVHAIRTPMQWTSGPAGDFSIEHADALPVPLVSDPVFGFQSVNVENRLRSPGSFLRWLRRLLALRAEHPVFGAGAYRPVATTDRHVVAFVRENEDDIILVVANLSRRVAIPQLDLAAWNGLVPEELLDRTIFAPIQETPTALTLGGRAFYLLRLLEAPVDITPPGG